MITITKRYTTSIVLALLSASSAVNAQSRADDIQAARAGDLASQIRVGVALAAEPDAEAADSGARFLKLAVQQGSAHAAQQLGIFYSARPVANRDDAVAYFAFAVAQDDARALLQYALLLQSGSANDREQSKVLMTRAAELYVPGAVAWLVTQFTEDGDLRMADSWHRSLDEQQWAFGNAQIATEYMRGELLDADPELAETWLSRIPEEFRDNGIGYMAAEYASSPTVRRDERFATLLFERAIAGDDPWVINNYAWMLATGSSGQVRNGQRAVSFMEDSLQRFGERGAWLDTLAAAYAEAGQFDLAVATQDKALTMFENESPADVDDATSRRDLYAEGQPWRE